MDNETTTLSEYEASLVWFDSNLVNFSALTMTALSIIALLVNVYLLNVSLETSRIDHVQVILRLLGTRR